MTTAAPSIQRSVFGSMPTGFAGLTNYSNPHIVGLVTKKYHSSQGEYYNSFGDWLGEVGDKLYAATHPKLVKQANEAKAAVEEAKEAGITDEDIKTIINKSGGASNIKNVTANLKKVTSEVNQKAIDSASSKYNNVKNGTDARDSKISSLISTPIFKWSLIGLAGIAGIVIVIKLIKK